MIAAWVVICDRNTAYFYSSLSLHHLTTRNQLEYCISSFLRQIIVRFIANISIIFNMWNLEKYLWSPAILLPSLGVSHTCVYSSILQMNDLSIHTHTHTHTHRQTHVCVCVCLCVCVCVCVYVSWSTTIATSISTTSTTPAPPPAPPRHHH